MDDYREKPAYAVKSDLTVARFNFWTLRGPKMKKKRLCEKKIIDFQEARGGGRHAVLARRHGVGEQSIYRRNASAGVTEISNAR